MAKGESRAVVHQVFAVRRHSGLFKVEHVSGEARRGDARLKLDWLNQSSLQGSQSPLKGPSFRAPKCLPQCAVQVRSRWKTSPARRRLFHAWEKRVCLDNTDKMQEKRVVAI